MLSPLNCVRPPVNRFNRSRSRIKTFCFFLGSVITAYGAVIDYTADVELTEIPVKLPDGEITLADALKSIEGQSNYTFAYVPSAIAADALISHSGDTLSLADTLYVISDATGAVFERQNGKIAVRMKTDADEIRRPQTLVDDTNPAGSEAALVEGFSMQTQQFQSQRDQLSMERKVSAGMMTFLSTEDMSKFGGSDLSDVVNRMVGVNVVEGRFAVVRGLSDRYSSTLVNGLPMPSPDPLRQGVQLDLFPTSIIDNIVTHKNALPNMPMNSSGAAFELHTKTFTDDPSVWIKTGYSINSNAQSKFLRNYNNAAYSFFPFNKNSFGFVPAPNAPVDGSKLSNFVGVHEGSAPITPNFELGMSDGVEYWGKRKVRFVVAASYDSSAKTSEGWEQDRLAGSGIYYGRTSPLNRTGSLFNKELPGYGLHYDLTRSDSSVLLGGLGGLQFDLDEEGRNKITFTTLYSQSANNRAQHKANGQISREQADATRKLVNDSGGRVRVETPPGYFPYDSGGNSPSTKIESIDIVGWGQGNSLLLNNMAAVYEERNLTAYQLGGEHDLTDWSSIKLSWGITYASTKVDSNASDMNYVETLPGKYGSNVKRYGYSSATDMEGSAPYALKRTWTNINEDLYGGRLDLEYGFDFWNNLEAKVKGGVYYQKTTRDTNQVDVQGYLKGMLTADTLEEYIEKIVAGGGNLSTPGLSSAGSTANVTREHQAAYLMLNLPIFSNVTLTGGARFEHLSMSSQGNVQFVGSGSMNNILNNPPFAGAPSLGTIISYTDPTSTAKFSKDYILPSAVLSWNITDDLIFRVGGSHTVALPSMREMSPYFSWDSDFNNILGNPNLKPVDVYAGEARLEYYTESGGMISAGAFYKQLKNPIERFSWYINTGSNKGEVDTFWNSPENAQIIGYEIEARHHLGFITEELKTISIGVNWSQMEAWIPISDVQRMGYAYPRPGGGYDGPAVGADGSINMPKNNRLYDQPKWTANADISWVHPDWGTGVTLMVYAQSDVLSRVGNGYTLRVDEYTLPYYELNLAITQRLWDNWTVKFTVSNLTDTERGIKYSDIWLDDAPTKRSYKVGQTYGISVEYKF